MCASTTSCSEWQIVNSFGKEVDESAFTDTTLWPWFLSTAKKVNKQLTYRVIMNQRVVMLIMNASVKKLTWNDMKWLEMTLYLQKAIPASMLSCILVRVNLLEPETSIGSTEIRRNIRDDDSMTSNFQVNEAEWHHSESHRRLSHM